MVEQMLADRPVGDDGNPEAFQEGGRPDAGALQDGGRMDRAGAQQDLAPCPHGVQLATDLHLHTVGMGTIALEAKRIDITALPTIVRLARPRAGSR